MTNTTMSNEPSRSAEPERTAASRAKDATAEVVGGATEQASEVAAVSKEQVGDVAEDAREHARHLIHESRQQLRGQANEQAQRVAATLADIGRQLDDMARGEGAPTGSVAGVTEQLASVARDASGRLEQRGFDGVLDETKRFARNKPGMFVLASLGTGFAIGRVLRSADTHALMEAAKPTETSDATPTQQIDSPTAVDLCEPGLGL